MKKKFLQQLFLCLIMIIFIGCKNNKIHEIEYIGTKENDSSKTYIQLIIGGFANNSIIYSYYTFLDSDLRIELNGNINNGVLILTENNTEKKALFIFNDFEIGSDILSGIFFNPNDNDFYNVTLTKQSGDEQIEIENVSEDNEITTIRASDLRNYVGLINQGYHPYIANFFKELLDELDLHSNDIRHKRILEGGFGSGFIYVDTDGKNYVITNFHVISQSYSPSISFIKADGSILEYKNLKIIRIDEDLDLALLAFPDDQRPFERGLKINDINLDDGEAVYSAGFPGFASIPIWQFGMGYISNHLVYLPKDYDIYNLIGPFIQHTAEVDPGNSGGPLLIDINQSRNYTVIGVNTLKASGRQAANYAIPAKQVLEFIDLALGKTIINEDEMLEQRINAFFDDIKSPKTDYSHIYNYLADNLIIDLFSAFNEPIQNNVNFENNINEDILIKFVETLFNEPIKAVKILTGHAMHDVLGLRRTNDVIIENIDYTNQDLIEVSFFVNNVPFYSEWINEYGIWRIMALSKIKNNSIERATPLTIGTTLNDNIDSESLWYIFDIQSPSWLNIYTGGNLNTRITLYNNQKDIIAIDNNSGINNNANLTIALTGGKYFIEISELNNRKGSFSLHSRITSGNINNNTMEQAAYITAGLIITSQFQNRVDKWYKIEVPSNANRLTVYTEGQLDTKISLYNSHRRLIAEDNDSGDGYNARVNHNVQGTVFIKIEEYYGRSGEFRLITQLR